MSIGIKRGGDGDGLRGAIQRQQGAETKLEMMSVCLGQVTQFIGAGIERAGRHFV